MAKTLFSLCQKIKYIDQTYKNNHFPTIILALSYSWNASPFLHIVILFIGSLTHENKMKKMFVETIDFVCLVDVLDFWTSTNRRFRHFRFFVFFDFEHADLSKILARALGHWRITITCKFFRTIF